MRYVVSLFQAKVKELQQDVSCHCACLSSLTQEITTLWSNHVRLSADRKLISKELRQIKAKLAERLFEMKALLSRPGRGGQWSGWLKGQKVPRSTAERLVARYAESLSVEDKNVPTEAPDPEKLARDLWRPFGKALATEEAVIRFIACIAEISGVPYELRPMGC